jgi:hypothetical protein
VGIFTHISLQVYLDRLTHGQFHGSYFEFLPHYFNGFQDFGGNMPWTGMHLWYLLALFIFSLLFLPLFRFLMDGSGQGLLNHTGSFLARPGAPILLALPTVALLILIDPDSALGNFENGGWNYIIYITFFLGGFLIISHESLQRRIQEQRWLSLAAGLVLLLVDFSLWRGNDPAYGSLRFVLIYSLFGLCSWSWILAILGFGMQHLTSSTPFLKYANEAVLPFYVMHQTVLLVIGYFIVQLDIPDLVKFLVIASSSFGIIMGLYESLVRRVDILRILFGMKPQARLQTAPSGENILAGPKTICKGGTDMATDAIVLLEQLHCLTLINTEARTEPYIWPALIRIDDNTLNTPELVAMDTPLLQFARVVIKDSMQAGETAGIPSTVGILRARFEDNLVTRRLILVVALLENDDTPQDAMEAGFKAFNSELQAAVADNLFALSSADEEQTKEITDAISQRVQDRVTSAIEDGLSAYEKAKVFAGLLNLDDPIGSDFASFGKDALAPAAFTLHFEAKGKILGVFDTLSEYSIDGHLQIKPVVVDRCQPQVNAVNAAQEVVNGIEAEIKELQDELKGKGDEPPLPKSVIIAEIKRIRTEELAPAVAALQEARAALKACRDQLTTHIPPNTGGVLTQG